MGGQMTSEGSKVLILGGRDNWLDAAQALGVDLRLIQHEAMLTDRQRALGPRLQILDRDDHGEIRRAAVAWHASERFDLILSSYEGWMQLAADLARMLGIKGMSPEAVRVSRDKLSFRQCLANHPEIPSIDSCECASVEQVLGFFRRIQAPIIVKPVLGTASAGVTVVRRPEDIDEAIKWVAAPEAWMRHRSGSFMCEKYIDGEEFSIDVMSDRGVHRTMAIAKKAVVGKHRISVGHTLPASFDPATLSRIEAAVFAMLDAIGQRTGPTHTEFKIDQNVPRIIETQTRFGGSYIWEMIELTTGVHLPRHTLATFLGVAEPSAQPKVAAAAVRFLSSLRGTLQGVGRIESVRALPGVYEVSMTAPLGTRFHDICRFEDRHGYVLCGGGTPVEAYQIADQAIRELESQLTIEVEASADDLA